jgi:hypothetical protein
MSIPPPPPRPASTSGTAIAIAVAIGVAGLAATVLVFYPHCLCPGATPLGTALSVGNGTGVCPAGNGSSLSDCAYSFSVTVYPSGQPPAPIPSARDLTFQIRSSVGLPLNSSYLVTLTSQGGAWLGTWNSSSSTWTSSSQTGVCGGSDCLSTPLSTGEFLLLRSIPNGGLPYSHQGDHLTLEAVGGMFSGWVEAAID